MQYSVLFRKLVINDKSYYQVYDIKENFKITDEYVDINERNNLDNVDKEYFYKIYDEDKFKKLTFEKYVHIYCENKDEKELRLVDETEELVEIIGHFREEFKDFLTTESSVDNILTSMSEEVFHQDEAIINLMETLLFNHLIADTPMSSEEKGKLKKNIILYGPMGNGKNMILDSLKKHLDVPCVDIKLTPDLSTNVEKIMTELVQELNNGADLKNAIVIIRDNLKELAEYADELSEDPYMPLGQLINNSKFAVKTSKGMIDFNTITFITVTDSPKEYDIEEMGEELSELTGCDVPIYVKELTREERKDLLINCSNSRLNIYYNMLQNVGKELIIDDETVEYMINRCEEIGHGMHTINDLIDTLIRVTWSYPGDVCITKKYIDDFVEDMKKALNDTEIIEEKTLDRKKIFEIITKKVRSQDKPIRKLLHEIINNYEQATNDSLENPKAYINNILIRGESGTGKTLILNEISKLLNIPICITDSTIYSEVGFKGKDVADMLADLYLAADGNLERAERGILVIDEIDKKASGNSDIDVSRSAVLNGLLKIIEGAIMPIEVGDGIEKRQIMFDTSRLTIITAGAFEDIEQFYNKRLGLNRTVGYGTKEPKKDEDPKLNEKDYIAYGLTKQFINRFDRIINLNKLTVADLRDIMINSKISKLNTEKAKSKIEFIYQDDFYDLLAQKAYDKKAGARGISKAFLDVLDNIEIEEIDPDEYSQIIFTGECVNDPSKVKLIKATPKKVKKLTR